MSEFHDTPRDTKILIAKKSNNQGEQKGITNNDDIYIASTINTQTYYHEHSLPSLLLEGCETTIVGIPYTGNDEGCCYVW